MNVLYFLIPLALFIGALFTTLFIWATKNGQYDDLETPAVRILIDDENKSKKRK